MDADVFKNDFRHLQLLVLCVFRIVGQQGLVSGRNGSHGVADELRTQFRYSFAHAIVAGVVQVVTLPKTLLPFLVLPNDARQEIAGLPERVLSGLQFLVGFGIHFQDDTSRPHVRGAADELTGVL